MRTTIIRQWQIRVLSTTALAVCLFASQFAAAAPISIATANVWRADRMPNPIGFPATALVPWVELAVESNIEDTVVTASVAGNTYNLSRIPTGVLSGTYYTQVPFDIALTDEWTITATNGADTATAVRPAFPGVQPMPFVSDIGFTGVENNITVNWAVSPEGLARLATQQVTIWDLTSNASPTTVQFFNIGPDPRSIDLSTLGLSQGALYAVEINNVERNMDTGFIDAFSGNWLSGWSLTDGEVSVPVPVPEPGMLSLLLAALAGIGFTRRRLNVPGMLLSQVPAQETHKSH